MNNVLSKITSVCSVTTITGCAFVVDTNRVVEIPVPTIGVTDSIADVQIMEPISGTRCSRKLLSLFKSGEETFLNTSGDEPSSPVDRAKAAAMYNALRGAKKTDLTNDILVNPVYNIVTRDPWGFSFLLHDVCVQVKGYRAVVKGFKPAETITRPPERKEGTWLNFFGFGK